MTDFITDDGALKFRFENTKALRTYILIGTEGTKGAGSTQLAYSENNGIKKYNGLEEVAPSAPCARARNSP